MIVIGKACLADPRNSAFRQPAGAALVHQQRTGVAPEGCQCMTTDPKRAKFEHARRSLAATEISTKQTDSLPCPLCWQETRFDRLTLEHIVPSAVGGTQTVLTCRGCNNDHGSDFDAHLAQHQSIVDAFRGHGTLRTKLNVNGHQLSANLEWGDGHKHFHVVGKATNPASSDAAEREFVSGKVFEIDLTLFFGYDKTRFQKAVLRAAYLILFKCFGYEYARHDVVQAIRRRITDPTLEHPRLASLIIEAKNFSPGNDRQHYIVPGNVNGVEFFLVIIRVRRSTTSYLGAYMPVPVARCNEFFDLMEQCAKEHNGETLTIPEGAIFG